MRLSIRFRGQSHTHTFTRRRRSCRTFQGPDTWDPAVVMHLTYFRRFFLRGLFYFRRFDHVDLVYSILHQSTLICFSNSLTPARNNALYTSSGPQKHRILDRSLEPNTIGSKLKSTMTRRPTTQQPARAQFSVRISERSAPQFTTLH